LTKFVIISIDSVDHAHWEGDRPGGHHRKGVLTFRPLDPAPATLTVKLRQVAPVPERTFTGMLAR
jgi:predicted small integral membrane protein